MECSHAEPSAVGVARAPRPGFPPPDEDDTRSAPSSVRSAAGLAGAAALAGALTWALARRTSVVVTEWIGWAAAGATVHAVRTEDVVALAALVVATGVAAWFALGLAVAAGCAAARTAGGAWTAGERLVAAHAPTLVRRALAVSTGTGLALAGAGGVATAATPPPDHLGWAVTSEESPGPTPALESASTTSTTAATVETLIPAPTSDPATAPTAPPATAPGAGPGTAATAEVTVRPGDTLWAIARAHLPADATAADVAAAWPAWYAANAGVIGSDPHLILPGQRLLEPRSSSSTGSADPTRTGADR